MVGTMVVVGVVASLVGCVCVCVSALVCVGGMAVVGVMVVGGWVEGAGGMGMEGSSTWPI